MGIETSASVWECGGMLDVRSWMLDGGWFARGTWYSVRSTQYSVCNISSGPRGNYPPNPLYRRMPRAYVIRQATIKNNTHAACIVNPNHKSAPLIFCKNTAAGKKARYCSGII